MWLVEVAGCRSLATPLLDEASVLVEFHHASIAGRVRLVAIGDEDIAVLADRDAGRPIKHVGAASGHPHLAEHHQHLAVLIELENLLAQLNTIFASGRHAQHGVLIVDIADPDVSVGVVHGERVWIGKHADTEAPEQLAGPIKLQDRWICLAAVDTGGVAWRHCVEAAMEDPDRAVRCHMNANHLTPFAAVHRLGQRRPALDEPVRIGKSVRLVLRHSGTRGDCDCKRAQRDPTSQTMKPRHARSPGNLLFA